MHKLLILLAGMVLLLPQATAADDVNMIFGGDQYASGQNVAVQSPVEHDAFAAGYDVVLGASVSGDAHLAGFNVSASSNITGDIYAAGFSVTLAGPIGGDATAAGNIVSQRSSAPVGGNVRLAGATVLIAAPIGGSALVTGQTLTLDAVISGDLSFFGESIIFAPGAKVDGLLTIQAPKPITVPPSVASADRVKFELLVTPDYVTEAERTATQVIRSFWPAFWIAAFFWLVLMLVGAVFIALMPRGMSRLQAVSGTRPFRNLGLGVLAFASVLGLVPVVAMTVIGILALPLVALYVVVACGLAYLAGVYFLGLKLSNAFVSIDTNLKRAAVLAIALVVATLLGMIPILGWFLILAFLVFGFGIIAVAVMVKWSTKDVLALQAEAPPAAPAAATPGP